MNAINPFQFAPMPHIHFGWDIRHELLSSLTSRHLKKVVIITGKTLSQPNQFGHELSQTLAKQSLVKSFVVSGEPSPDLVDDIVTSCPVDTDIVIGLGGGSVLDTAKAVAGLIPSQTSVMDYLEGVGLGKPFHVETTPFIAVPTTAGTGSETTKNSVLSRIGAFKKSFRDDKLLAKEAWLDPALLTSCPKEVLYATGMDAFTQLLESYTTLKPNPITDALAWQGMALFKDAFEAIDSQCESQQQTGYGNLMLAATLSGTTLANAGLGAVHGLAGPIGAFFEAPHGIVCARLLAPITKRNIDALQSLDTEHAHLTIQKYEKVAKLMGVQKNATLSGFIDFLQTLSQKYAPQGLVKYGLNSHNIAPVIANCRSGSMLGNAVTLTDDQLREALLEAL